MRIKRKKLSLDEEKQIITGMIVSDQYLKEIQTIISNDLFQLPFSKKISDWCIKYYAEYKQAPREAIQDIYNTAVRGNKLDDDTSEIIGKFLSDVSEKYEKVEHYNARYYLEQAEKYLRAQNLRNLKNDIDAALQEGDVEEGEKIITNFKRPVRPESKGINVLTNKVAAKRALLGEEEVLFILPGALGDMIGALCRDDFIAMVAPGKRGKTWWLQEIAFRALYAKLKVLFISLEMTEDQVLRRMFQTILAEPKNEKQIIVPYFEDDSVESKVVQKKGVNYFDAMKKAAAINKMFQPGELRLMGFPSDSYSVDDLNNTLDSLEDYEDFVPDVIVADYADIFKPNYRGHDGRQAIDSIWKGLRGVSQQRHLLMVTASHSGRSTYSKDATAEDIVEDVRKLNHVTGAYALNQTNEDKKLGIMRVGTLVSRHEEYYVENEVVVTQALSMGKPYLDSRFKKDVIF